MRFNLPRLIGIAGRAGVGKDTLADYLVRQHGYVKRGLADPIKELLNDRFDWSMENWQNREWKESRTVISVCDFIPESRYGVPAFGLSPRDMAQWLGTEVGRNIGGEDTWVNLMEREWVRLNRSNTETFGELPRMVVPDIRFDNEARRIHLLGGVVIRITRGDAPEVTAHVSEAGVSDELVNAEVQNDKDIITFLREAVYALEATPRGA